MEGATVCLLNIKFRVSVQRAPTRKVCTNLFQLSSSVLM
jgi:hypothetical protein